MDFPKLFTVGPVYVRDEVREEMGRQMFSHRSSDYTKLHSEVVDKLHKLMKTENEIFLYTSSATGIWESCARNCVEKSVISCANGAFSERFGRCMEANGKKVQFVEKPWGEAILPEDLEMALQESDAEAVTIVHNETSTGVMNPLEELCAVAKEYGVLTLVDCVSSMGGAPVEVDKWGIDVCLFSVQKCMAVPPGLAVASVSEKAMEKSYSLNDRGYYFDFQVLHKYGQKDQTPATPPVPQIFGLDKAAELILEEGLEAVWARHKKVSDYVKMRCRDMGFSLYPDEQYASQTLSCMNAEPRNPVELLKRMKEKGYVIGSGYGKLKETTFRVGNMGNVHMGDVEEMLDVMAQEVKGL